MRLRGPTKKDHFQRFETVLATRSRQISTKWGLDSCKVQVDLVGEPYQKASSGIVVGFWQRALRERQLEVILLQTVRRFV